MKKQVFLLFMFLLPIGVFANDSGSCGIDLTWTFIESTKTLSISGIGEMYDYPESSRPWKKYGTQIQNLIIEDGVTKICKYAFWYSNLTSVTIGASVKSIGDWAFRECLNINAVYISDLAAWYNISFGTYDSNPLYYAGKLYINFQEIKDMVIPNNISSIKKYAFAGYKGLTSVTIPNSVTAIEDYAFMDCSGLVSLTIPNSVITIGKYSFSDCKGLTSLVIGNNVISIGTDAFRNCGCQRITSLNPEPPKCENGAFNTTNVPLYVPQGSVAKYKTADVWCYFVSIQEIDEDSDTIYLSINDGGNGKTQLLVDEAKPYFTMTFKADAGWKIHSVTLNGYDVTYNVGTDGKYTTPPLTVSSTLNVVYEQSTQAINTVYGAPVKVRAGNGEIIISRDSSEAMSVEVYLVDGKQVLQQTLTDSETRISVPEGHVYLIKAGRQQFKLGM